MRWMPWNPMRRRIAKGLIGSRLTPTGLVPHRRGRFVEHRDDVDGAVPQERAEQVFERPDVVRGRATPAGPPQRVPRAGLDPAVENRRAAEEAGFVVRASHKCRRTALPAKPAVRAPG